MSRRLKYSLTAATAALAFTSCGQLLKTMPPIDIGDPLKLSLKAFPLPVDRGGQVEFEVPDLNIDPRGKLPFGQVPRKLIVIVPITHATLIGSCDASKVHEFDVTLQKLSVHAADSAGSAQFTLPAPIRLEFTRGDGALFTAKSNRPVMSFDQADRALNVLTRHGMNTVQAEAMITTDNDDLTGCLVVLKTGVSKTLIKF